MIESKQHINEHSNTNSCSSRVGGRHHLASNLLQQPCVTDLLPTEHVVTFLGWFHSVPEADVLSSWQSQHAEISTRTSASQTMASCRESNTVGKLTVSTDFSRALVQSPVTNHFRILHTDKTSTT